MAKTKGRKNAMAKNDKLKTLKDLPTCMVVLHNIAFNKDLIKLYKLHFLEKEKKKLKHSSSCINTSKNSSNVWMLKEKMQEDNTVDETSQSKYVTRSRLRKLSQENQNKECKDLKLLSDVSCKPKLILPGFIVQGQHINCDTSVISFSSKSNDEASNISLNTHCSYTQEVPINIKRHDTNRRSIIQKKNSVKRKLYFDKSEIVVKGLESIKISSDESYSDEKKVTNYNSKMQKISNEGLEVPSMKSNADLFHQKYDKLDTILTTERNGKAKLEQCKRPQTVKTLFSNFINTNVENKISKTSENIEGNSKNVNFSDNFFTTYNINESQNEKVTSTISSDLSLTIDSMIQATDCSESILNPFSICPTTPTVPKTKQKVPKRLSDFLTYNNKIKHANKTNKNTKRNLPKITEEHILPKGTIKIMKISANNENLQNNFSKQVFLEQNKYNDTNSSVNRVSCIDNTLDSTNILKEKECHISESTPGLNNNINLKNKNIDKLRSTKIDHKDNFFMEENDNIHNVNANDVNSETTYEDSISNYQEQSNKLHNNEERENNLVQNNKNSETNSDESILKNDSLLIDISKSCIDNRSSIFGSKEEVTKQNRKRIAEENAADIKLNNKKKRLNRNYRTTWLQNNVTCTKLNHQQLDDFSNIDTMITVESNIAKENYSKKQGHLRERSNKERSKLPTSENEFNNKNSVESKQIHSDIENDIIISTNTKTEEFCKCRSFNKETAFNKTYKEKDIQTDPVCSNHCRSTSKSTSEETQHINQIDGNIYEDTIIQKECRTDENKNDGNDGDDSDDCDDCISLYAESFDTTFYEKTLGEQKKPSKSLHSDVPYLMTVSSFNKFVKQNATEFNKEYAKYENNSIEMADKSDLTKKEFNNQSGRTVHTDRVLETRTASKVPFEAKNVNTLNYQLLKKHIRDYINGHCFMVLRRGKCYKQLYYNCKFEHNLQDLVNTIYEEDPKIIISMIQQAMYLGYTFIGKMIFIKSLHKLTVDQILIIFDKFYNIRNIHKELTAYSKYKIIQSIVKELLNRQMPLKTIVDSLMKYIPSEDLANLLIYVEKDIKNNEYWNTVRTLVLKLLQINEVENSVIHKILTECIENENFTNIKDVNDNLINKISHTLMSTLDKDLIERFKSFLTDKTANNSAIVQNFGKNISETIASPDGNTNSSEMESPKLSSTDINISRPENMDHINKVNGEVYTLRRIDNLPDAQSIYRDHEHLWKFYVDLERFKKGLLHHDYDYVISILKSYSEGKQDESSFFTRSCCSILRTEVKRSEYHLTNIIRRTVQMDTFNILGKMLFNIGLDVLTSLVDQEAWGLALWLIQSLEMYNLPYNAEYFLLSAEIYLANKKALKAYDLLKHQNILCTNRDKWYVTSTINDEHVRSKIMYILLDLFCNDFIDYAFFLFQFLLKDQSSQYNPIDLSCYVDKLIISFLSKKDTNLIVEMANIILKYTFPLNTTTCRALISTLIHLDENLARQIYNYAEGIGIYPKMKLWPVTYIIINNDLTEEEIYLTFVQLLKNLVINFGHAIEFAKPHQIKVYFILEIKSINAQFYCAELQNYYNNKAITNIRTLIRNVLKNRFDPPILLMRGSKGRIYKLQSTSVINYLKTEHCN